MRKMTGASSATCEDLGRRSTAMEIYLDHQASTPCDPAVVEAMLPFLVHESANPSSPSRAGGRAKRALDNARELVADALQCMPTELFFTSGATEANNLAILGCGSTPGTRSYLAVCPIEHKSVLEPSHSLAGRGFGVLVCPVRPDGQVDLGALLDLVDENVRLVSVQLANNEIGTIQPIREIAQLAHRAGALMHVDAAQAFGKIPIAVDDLEIDLLSISGHKCHGPKGVGALFVRGGAASGLIEPVFGGGGQEGGFRPGTPNVPGIVGLGEAARICMERMELERRQISSLRDRLEHRIINAVKGVIRNGAIDRRLPGSTSLTFPLSDAEAIIANVPEIAFSSSSACNAGAVEPSYVLRAIGLSANQAHRTVRLGLGRFTTAHEVDYAGEKIAEAVNQVAEYSAMTA